MLGAIIGDIVGSTREWHNIKTEDFEPVPQKSRFTDDTVMTLAVAEWLIIDPEHQPETLVSCMQRLGRKYPDAGYGKMFSQWLMSDHPQPYNSFGNGSAMRVSPVGLYANTLEEALELARITASVSHNHPEGIRGAQAIAGSVFLHKNISLGEEEKVRHFIAEKIGYNLAFNLDDIRGAYGFDVTCQGSVPIAIKAYLERSGYSAEKALRLAISMGGDSDTIGSMTASIAGAQPFYRIGGGFSDDLVNQCRALLPADLLDINDRFEAFVNRSLHQSYYIGGKLFAGEYPGDKYGELAEAKLKRMHHFGVRHFVDLTEEGELRPYHHLLPRDTTYLRFPIRDVSVPNSVEAVHQLIDEIKYLMQQDGYTYIHCWGGAGRTGTIVACYEARQMEKPTLENALTAMRNRFSNMPKASHRKFPETQEQIDFLRRFVDSSNEKKEVMKLKTKDRIRGSLVAGAAGDALGYTVEFMSRKSILAQYGSKGITQFDLSSEGKALVSDDTQMTLFTACGMLMAVTLAGNDRSDAENIRQLGEGWTGEEAWAIALYCALRHADSVEDAIIAAVNHDGDSDSTGSVCGNIMGAIYGYETIRRQRLFCPQGKELEQTLELSNIILTLADDLYTSCIISEYDHFDTPEKRQWYERYCEMKPVGI